MLKDAKLEVRDREDGKVVVACTTIVQETVVDVVGLKARLAEVTRRSADLEHEVAAIKEEARTIEATLAEVAKLLPPETVVAAPEDKKEKPADPVKREA